MNKKFFIPILLATTLFSMPVFSDNTDDDGSTDSKPTPGGPGGPGGRPTAPAKYAFACEASNGFMTIAFRNASGNAEVDIVNRETGVSYRYAFDTVAPLKCFVDRSALGYSVTVTLESGQKYYRQFQCPL